jgi:hypothetical protein
VPAGRNAAHLERLVDEKKRARHHRGLDRLAKAAPNSKAFFRTLAEQRQNLGSATARLLQLLDAVGPAELEEALVEALERDTVHVGAVRQITDRRRSERGLPPPVSIPVTRGEHGDLVVTPHALSTYDALKKEDQTRPPTSPRPSSRLGSKPSASSASSLAGARLPINHGYATCSPSKSANDRSAVSNAECAMPGWACSSP